MAALSLLIYGDGHRSNVGDSRPWLVVHADVWSSVHVSEGIVEAIIDLYLSHSVLASVFT
jgi:hypothetical protein